jgi:hypothetical protein
VQHVGAGDRSSYALRVVSGSLKEGGVHAGVVG